MYQMKKFFVLSLLAVIFLSMPLNLVSSAREAEALPPFKIVQLGDSYSAGNGARSESGERNYHGVEGCYRSPTNWGSQFAESLADTFAVTYINRACSGGVASHIQNRRDMGTSFKNINGTCPSPEYPDEEFYEDTSLLKCTRFIKPQIDAVDSSVDLVLMTMGGNDLGFATIVENCFVKGFRSPAPCREAVDNASDQMPRLQNDLINTFAALRAKLRPDARIAYVSYPHIMLDVEYQLEKGEDIYNRHYIDLFVGPDFAALAAALGATRAQIYPALRS